MTIRYYVRRQTNGALAHDRRGDRIISKKRLVGAFLAALLATTVFIGCLVLIGRSSEQGCIRDADTITVLRGILIRGKQSNAELYSQGIRSEVEFRQAEKDYGKGLKLLVAPKC